MSHPRRTAPRYVFLDVGETMLRVTQPGATYQTILARHGYDVPADTLNTTIREVFRSLDGELPPVRRPDHTLAPDVARQRRERMLAGVLERVGVASADTGPLAHAFYMSWLGTDIFQLYPDVPPTLAALRAAGYRLGIVSNWEPRLAQLCESHGIHAHFEFVVCSEVEGYAKPHRRMFERALELARVAPDAVVHVGDSYPEDVEGARAVGIHAVLVDRPGHGRVPYQPTIRSLDELPGLLARI